MADVWVCSQCRSLNQGKDRCYKCRAPKDVGGVAPTDLPTIGPSAPIVPSGRYRSSAFRAVLAAASLMAFTTLIVSWVVLASIVLKPTPTNPRPVISGPVAALYDDLWLLLLGLLAVTLLAWAAWISRVVANIPVLTGEYPRATPRWTFIQVLIPGYNLRWIPSILRDVLRHLDPRGNGDALVAAAMLPPVVAVIGWLALRYLLTGTTIAGAGLSSRQAVELIEVVGQVTVGLLAVGAVMLVVIISRIERRAAALARDAQGAAA
jgi:hypothetical protein